MLDRFRKQKPEVLVKPDVTLRFEIPDEIKKEIDGPPQLVGSDAKVIFREFLKTLNRAQLLCISNDSWYKEHELQEWLWEEYNDEEWNREWPLGGQMYESTLPDIVMNTIPLKGLDKKNPVDMKALVKQIQGMQKKLDKLAKVIEAQEICMSGKTFLES